MNTMEFPRLELLQALNDLVMDISPNVFISTRPSAVSESMEDFIILRLPQGIRQPADTYQLTTGQIVVFARDIESDLENTIRLEEMQKAVVELFPIRDNRFLATQPILLYGGTDGLGFHSLIIQFNIRVHKDFDVNETQI